MRYLYLEFGVLVFVEVGKPENPELVKSWEQAANLISRVSHVR